MHLPPKAGWEPPPRIHHLTKWLNWSGVGVFTAVNQGRGSYRAVLHNNVMVFHAGLAHFGQEERDPVHVVPEDDPAHPSALNIHRVVLRPDEGVLQLSNT